MALSDGRSEYFEESTGKNMKNTNAIVGTRIPRDLVKGLERIEAAEHTDRSTTVRNLLTLAIQRWNMDYYSRQYAQGRLSIARCAEEAGVTLWEFQHYLRQHKMPAQYDAEDFEHDLKTIAES
jgi:predicted HTH domain antitoxin